MGRPRKEVEAEVARQVDLEPEVKKSGRYRTILLTTYIGKVGISLAGSDKVLAAIELMFEDMDGKQLVDKTERKGEVYYTFKI